MLYRKAYEDLLSWKNNKTTALLIDGARQVGKTFLIRQFGKENFRRVKEINFSENLRANNLLLEVKDYEDFLARLSLLIDEPLEEGDLLFFDEIQFYYEQRKKRIDQEPSFEAKYVDILTLSKTIADKGKWRLILSGSLLGTTLFNVRLNPMGYLDTITMYPLDFEEFLLANNISKSLISELEECFKKNIPVDDYLHLEMMEKWREFILVGGMPKVVSSFINNKDYEEVSYLQNDIISWYKRDIMKYAAVEDRLIINEIYEKLPSEISQKNKKFVKSHMDDLPNFKNLDVKDRFLWLQNAGIAIPVYNVSNPVYPLKTSQDYKLVKLFANDVGLFTATICENDDKGKLLSLESDFDFGAIYENAVAQLLLAHGYKPYFHSLKKEGEIDFIISEDFNVLPLEIKSGSPNKKGLYEHKALDKLLSRQQKISKAYLFGNVNVKTENQNIYYYPIYMVDFLRK